MWEGVVGQSRAEPLPTCPVLVAGPPSASSTEVLCCLLIHFLPCGPPPVHLLGWDGVSSADSFAGKELSI